MAPILSKSQFRTLETVRTSPPPGGLSPEHHQTLEYMFPMDDAEVAPESEAGDDDDDDDDERRLADVAAQPRPVCCRKWIYIVCVAVLLFSVIATEQNLSRVTKLDIKLIIFIRCLLGLVIAEALCRCVL